MLLIKNTFSFGNVEPSCVIMQHIVYTEVSGVSLVALTAQRGVMPWVKKKSRVNRQHSDDWKIWTHFEQAEEKGLSASSPLGHLESILLWRYVGTQLLQLTARNVRCGWSIFPHILMTLLSEDIFEGEQHKCPLRVHEL